MKTRLFKIVVGLLIGALFCVAAQSSCGADKPQGRDCPTKGRVIARSGGSLLKVSVICQGRSEDHITNDKRSYERCRVGDAYPDCRGYVRVTRQG